MNWGFLRSRIARRVFGTFVLCALAPLALYAWFSTRRIERQLTEQASSRIELELKTMSMGVADRVGALASELEQVVEQLANVEAEGGPPESALMRDQQRSFMAVALMDSEFRVLAQHGEPTTWPTLDAREQAHLERGQVLLCTRTDESGVTTPYLAKRAPGRADGARTLVATPGPERLWSSMQFAPPGTEIAVLSEHGDPLFASSHFGAPDLAATRSALREVATGWLPESNATLSAYRTLFLRPQFLGNLVVVLSQSRDSVLAPASGFRASIALSMALAFLLVSWLSFRQVRTSLVPVEALAEATARVARKDLSTRVQISTGDEFEELGHAFNHMTASLERHARVEAGLHDLGLALHSELGLERLIRAILDGASSVTSAPSVCLFLAKDEQSLELVGARGRNDAREPESTPALAWRIALDDHEHVAVRSVEQGAVVVDELRGADLELARTLAIDASRVACVPLRDHEQRLLGVLQVALDGVADDQRDAQVRLVESVGAHAALALTKNELIDDFRELVISISEVFAIAIDEKSPYTGAHCRRVPEIMMLMAESAMRAEEGPLREFRPSEEELYEIRIAALMHDCGKIATPVHVVDKATKLQTIFDRIALVDLRFELLARDAEIERLRALSGVAPEEGKVGPLDATLREERDSLRRCNTGSERMADADLERVQALASSRRWRDLDGNEHTLLTDEELENLSVRGGTLTPAERKIINDHIVVTIKMLEQLRYPKGLRNVPLIAGAHHERMDGRGYPRGLVREQIPWSGRMLALADIFEALTDSDRPYKKAMSLQEALEIMGRMASTGHLDQDVFQRFVEDEVYLRYARKYLPPDRMQTVDLSRVQGLRPGVARSAAA